MILLCSIFSNFNFQLQATPSSAVLAQIRGFIVPGAGWKLISGKTDVQTSKETGIEFIFLPSTGKPENKESARLVVYLMGNAYSIYHPCSYSDIKEIISEKKGINFLVLKYPENCSFSKTSELFAKEIEAKRNELGLEACQVRIIGRSLGGFVGCNLAAKHGYQILPVTAPASIAGAFKWMTKGAVPESISEPVIWSAGWSGNSIYNFLKVAGQSDGSGNAQFIISENDQIVGPGFKKQLHGQALHNPKLKERLALPCSDSRSLAGHCLENVGHNDDFFGSNSSCKHCGKSYGKIIGDFVTSP